LILTVWLLADLAALPLATWAALGFPGLPLRDRQEPLMKTWRALGLAAMLGLLAHVGSQILPGFSAVFLLLGGIAMVAVLVAFNRRPF
jgi:hypothetical protein